MTILLSGITGSKAYGLDTPESDTDRSGVFASPARELLSLHPPAETRNFPEGDGKLHEAGKFIHLALKSNPSILEVLWLESYEICLPLGEKLIAVRESFPSRMLVRNAYLGYATAQLHRIRDRGVASEEARPKAAKNARHLLRLLFQGVELYETGKLTVRLQNPELYREFGEVVANGNLAVMEQELALAEYAFDKVVSPLPEVPDETLAEDWLQEVRREYY